METSHSFSLTANNGWDVHGPSDDLHPCSATLHAFPPFFPTSAVPLPWTYISPADTSLCPLKLITYTFLIPNWQPVPVIEYTEWCLVLGQTTTVLQSNQCCCPCCHAQSDSKWYCVPHPLFSCHCFHPLPPPPHYSHYNPSTLWMVIIPSPQSQQHPFSSQQVYT
jgi:hypothetical protein